MWNPFRKTPQEPPSITSASPLVRADAVLSGMLAYGPNGHAQILVALSNTKINFEVHRDVMRKKGKEFTIDDFIRQNEFGLAQHKGEIAQRRLTWFLTAGLIYSLGDGNGDAEVEDRLVQIYILVADASEMMLDILRHNVIWDEGEKAFFPDKYMANRKATMQLYLPKALRKHPRFKAYAKEHEIWLSVLG